MSFGLPERFSSAIAAALIAGMPACGDVRREPITGPSGAGGIDTGAAGAGGSGGSAGAAARPPCTVNDDCPASTPKCNVTLGTCGACGLDADCRNGAPRCDVASGACVECLESTDCPGPGCPGAATCPRPEATLCHPTQHRCVECVTDGHCASIGERCSSALGVCATPCTDPTACPTDEPVCDAIVGFCVGCITDTDCSASQPYCRRSECTR